MAPPIHPPPPAASAAEVVVRLGDSVLDVRHLRAGRRAQDRFRIGEGHGVDLPLAIAGAGDDGALSLVQVGEAGVVLRLVDDLAGEIHEDGEILRLDDLRGGAAQTRRLPLGARAELRRGDLTIEVRALAADEGPAPGLGRAAIDRGFWLGQAGALALLGGLFVALATVEPAAIDLDRDYEIERQRIVVALANLPPATSSSPQEPPPPGPAPAAQERPERPTPPPLPRGPRLVADADVEREAAPRVEIDGASVPVPRGPQSGETSPRTRGDAAPETVQGGLLGEAAADWIAHVERRSQEHYRDTREDADAWDALTSAPPDLSRSAGGLALKTVVVDPTARGAVGITDREIAEAFMAQRAKARRRPRDDGFRERPIDARARDEARTVASTSPFSFHVGGPPQVLGSLDQARAGEVVKHNRPHLARCWTDARRRDPDLKARFDVAVTVGARGKVKRVEVPGSLDDPELGRCLAMAIREWRFDAPPDGEPSVVTYSLSFGGA